MSVPPRSSIRIGSSVCIILKCDQPTGKITIGNVKTILTASAFHPRGIKVELVNGSVGRVQSLNKSSSKNNDNNNANSDVVGRSNMDTVFRGGYETYCNGAMGFEAPSEFEASSDRNNRNLLDFIAPNQLKKINPDTVPYLKDSTSELCYEENFHIMRSILPVEYTTCHLNAALIRCNNVVDDAVLLCMEQGAEGMDLLVDC